VFAALASILLLSSSFATLPLFLSFRLSLRSFTRQVGGGAQGVWGLLL
jgi:hypothetical protein